MDACKEFRKAWLSGESAASEHLEQCEACARWASSSERLQVALAGLDRLIAPAELEERVAMELSGDRSRRLDRVLTSLVRHGAPSVLDERVAVDLDPTSVHERGHKAPVLGALDVHSAPAVLERLLQEELEEPERQRADRFAGSLERLHAPAALAERIGSVFRRRALGRRVIAPLATLAAAGLVVWIALRSGEPGSHRYRFEVLHASSLEGIDPMARVLVESLNGGAIEGGGRR